MPPLPPLPSTPSDRLPTAPTTDAVRSPGPDFLYLKLPSKDRIDEREAALEAALAEALDAQGLGSLISAGGSLGEVAADGFRHVAYRRLDLEVADLHQARVWLHRLLPELGAGPGTELHYSEGDRRLQDSLGARGWLLAQAG